MLQFWRDRPLDGWVRNRRDGGVEAVLAGPGGDVEAMISACRQGPRFARVDMVRVLDEAEPVAPGFRMCDTVRRPANVGMCGV